MNIQIYRRCTGKASDWFPRIANEVDIANAGIDPRVCISFFVGEAFLPWSFLRRK